MRRVTGLDEFVEKYVDSFTAWDILTLFGTSPNRLSKPDEIAGLVGRPQGAVESCLKVLAEKGFFEIEVVPGRVYYHWKPEESLCAGLHEFVTATADRRGRLRALSALLRKISSATAGGELN